mgnify:CR=1 FL=1
MWMAAIAQFGISALQGHMAAKAQAREYQAQAKATMEANRENFSRMGYQIGLLNVQRGQELAQLAQSRAQVREQGLSDQAEVAANAAASGTIGASVDAAIADTELQVQRQLAALDIENELGALNYNTRLRDTLLQGKDSQITMPSAPKQNALATMLGYVAPTVASYASAYMTLGLGKRAAAE